MTKIEKTKKQKNKKVLPRIVPSTSFLSHRRLTVRGLAIESVLSGLNLQKM